jgi:hypothetical protein
VLLVSEIHYASCNTIEPVLKLDGTNPRFVLNNTGCNFFISVDAFRCRDGERLVVCATTNTEEATPSPPPPPKSPAPSPSAGHASSPSLAPSTSAPSSARPVLRRGTLHYRGY